MRIKIQQFETSFDPDFMAQNAAFYREWKNYETVYDFMNFLSIISSAVEKLCVRDLARHPLYTLCSFRCQYPSK
jgi:hypothetical protein